MDNRKAIAKARRALNMSPGEKRQEALVSAEKALSAGDLRSYVASDLLRQVNDAINDPVNGPVPDLD